MKKSGKDRLKCAINESTRAPLTRSPFPNGEGCDTRILLSPYCHFERKREIFFVRGQAKDVRIAASGKHRASSESEGRCFMQTALRKKTETGKRKRSLGCARDDETRKRLFPFLFNLLRKPTPPRCARQPLPKEGARVDTPSFLWKEVPRRGGGWMGKAVSPTDKAFPAWGRWRAERAG